MTKTPKDVVNAVELFALALDAQWPLVHLLDLHHHLDQIWVVGFIHELESN